MANVVGTQFVDVPYGSGYPEKIGEGNFGIRLRIKIKADTGDEELIKSIKEQLASGSVRVADMIGFSEGNIHTLDAALIFSFPKDKKNEGDANGASQTS